MFDLQRLRVLRELKHRGTLAAVARALSYTPSAISQQLSLLESEVGVPLREQAGRGVRLTAQGEILVAHTEIVLEQLECAKAELAASMQEITGTVRLACFQTAALALVPDALARLRRSHPRLRVETAQIEAEHALPQLMSHDLDLVIAEEYPRGTGVRRSGLQSRELCVDAMRLALPQPSGAVSDRAAMRMAATMPWILEPAGTAARQWAMALCREAGFTPDVRFETTDVTAHLRSVQQGYAVALLPDLLWQGKPPAISLYDLPAEWGIRRIVTVVRKGGDGQPAIQRCRTALEAALHPTRQP
ncbi:LysR substrate-binding domain-containing protein [Streptomyces sp. DSM 41527]|uniref:LysR substrate-binding domain-containing protein n=1 Tax=Streptomyces mooreae TaxID=3075523 RepID=A0ABU2T4Q4_9ACTN|nr:LysR substrate-binding domain-containing protein [Streptomyces sp. DSM 41527]MDT0455973.1 LysR substrate-binding domain-containing protein [Streptomyces sp. DSM 41527]